MNAPSSKRHAIETRDGTKHWYQVGDHVAVYPFTRSRMNRTTLGCYGKSARTKPQVTAWMWGICYVNTDGLPSTWDATLRCFGSPMSPHDVRDLKADALVLARERVARVAQETSST